jgi:hypothetical protein
MILADINFADIMWSMLAFFFFVIILSMVFHIIGDIFRSDDLSGASKAIWAIFIIVVPWLAIFVYLIARGNGMAARALKSNQDAQEQFAAYAASVAPPANSATGEIKSAKELLDSGAISQPEFDRLKAAALAST